MFGAMARHPFRTLLVFVATVFCVIGSLVLFRIYEILGPDEDDADSQPEVHSRLTDEEIQKLCGWGGEVKAREEFDRLKGHFIPFLISDPENPDVPVESEIKRTVLWDVVLKIRGSHIPTGRQEIGDCFCAGTMVRTPKGDVPIEDVRVGDFVYTGEGKLTWVVSTRSRYPKSPVMTIHAYGIEPIRCTEDHRVLTGKFGTVGLDWVKAGELTADHYLVAPISCLSEDQMNYMNRQVKHSGAKYLAHGISSIVRCRDSIEDDTVVVYDIGVADPHHSFVANGVAVHNCVSWGMKHAVEYLLYQQIAAGEAQEWQPVFAPWIYGYSRCVVGGGRIGCNSDGSVGSWAAVGVTEGGVLSAALEGVPSYSGSIAKKWGCSRTFPKDEYAPEARKALVESAAQVKTWQEVREAICNRYPVTVASNQGFSTRGIVKDGKLWLNPSGSWAHQMAIIGYDTEPEDCFFILNSWGDFIRTNPPDDAPIGGFWVKASTVDRMVRQGDSFAISGQRGFPSQDWDVNILIRSKKAEVRHDEHLDRGVHRPDFAISF